MLKSLFRYDERTPQAVLGPNDKHLRSLVKRQEVTLLTAAELPLEELADKLELLFIERYPCPWPLIVHGPDRRVHETCPIKHSIFRGVGIYRGITLGAQTPSFTAESSWFFPHQATGLSL